jgi:hypothetical protein
MGMVNKGMTLALQLDKFVDMPSLLSWDIIEFHIPFFE